jgi:hypothetical protein
VELSQDPVPGDPAIPKEARMPGPSDLERFLGYARDFELAVMADAWAGIRPCFAEDARHLVHSEPPLALDDRGGDAVVAGLRASVYGMDRRFDARIPEVLAGPEVRPDGVWMRFALGLRRAGLPELRIEGEHLAQYEGGRIRLLEERIAPGTGNRVAAFLAEHAAALRPEGARFAPPRDPRDLRDLESALAQALVRAYACAKSRQDVGAALAACGEDFVLETVPLGIATRDRKQAEQQLGLFFASFPDYRVRLEGLASGEGAVASWGRAQLTWLGPFAGHAPSGRAAELPIFCVFAHAGGQLRGERFFFDLASLCEQIGLPLEAARDAAAAIRRASEREGPT